MYGMVIVRIISILILRPNEWSRRRISIFFGLIEADASACVDALN